MSGSITLALADRAHKKPLRKLPGSIEVPNNAEIEDVKKLVARQTGVKDFNRIGLFYPSSKKRIADRRALVRNQEEIMSNGLLLVQDLGPQASWRTVYLVEYLGPLLFHPFFYYLRPQLAKIDPVLYKDADKIPLTTVQKICFFMFVSHFAKRELETAFLHRFSANTMPAFNIIKNSAYYWLTAGLLAAFFIYSPKSFANRSDLGLLDYIGIALFLGGEVANYVVHQHLAGLRKPGSTEKGIPSCIGSSLVTCPNYMFEIIAWIGIILVSREWSVVLSIAIGTMYMASWSRDKEAALRETFGDKYKKKKYTLFYGFY